MFLEESNGTDSDEKKYATDCHCGIDADQEQVLPVYELNKGDLNSPVLVKGPAKTATPTLGDFVPYTNKVCLSALQYYSHWQARSSFSMVSSTLFESKRAVQIRKPKVSFVAYTAVLSQCTLRDMALHPFPN